MENTVTTALPPQDGKDYTLTVEGWVPEKSEDDILKEKWYTVNEAAKEIRCTHSKINYAIHKGYLKAKLIPDSSRHGHHYLVNENDLLAYITEPKKRHSEPVKGTYYGDDIDKKIYKEKKAAKKKEPKKVESKKVDISNLTDIVELLEEHINTIVTREKEAWYQKGFADGKLDVQLDHEDAYRKGFEEGKKQAKKDLMILIKEVG